jgi:hypothetical protein
MLGGTPDGSPLCLNTTRLFHVLTLVAVVVSLVLAALYEGMVVQLVRDVQDGRRDNTVGELFGSESPVLLPLIAVSILAGLGIGIGFLLLIVPGLILLTIWSVAAPVLVIERPGVLRAFGRSRELVRGYGWPVSARSCSCSYSSSRPPSRPR